MYQATFAALFKKKLSNTEGEFKESVAYKKGVLIFSFNMPCVC